MKPRDVELLYEVGTLRLIPRQWRRFLNPGSANLAEHHFRVMWTALIIAKHEKADTAKVLKMALMHDICESRTGDADYVARQYVERNETLGFSDMVAKTVLEEEFLQLWEEFEKMESLEAKVVKDADNLDIDFELNELEAQGQKLKKVWRKDRNWVSKSRLKTKTGKKLYEILKNANPHDWHIKGRNRIVAGDWAKPKKKAKSKKT